MKRAIRVLVPVVLAAICAGSRAQGTGGGSDSFVNNDIQNTNYQSALGIGGGNADSTSTSSSVAQGGDSVSWSNSVSEGGDGIGWSNSTSEGGIGWSDSDSYSILSLNTVSNYQSRVPPLTTYPPYLPMWNHGGWGTINAYFPNGPTSDDQVYQRAFDTSDPDDVRELKGILGSLPHSGPLEAIGGLLNNVRVLFGGPDNFHRGRGFEIANSLIRDRRPDGKPLLVFIDSYIDAALLKEEGYAYVGRLSLEGKSTHNWDLVYDATVAETLPWDVDILLISGGMKGVTEGSNMSFPSAAGGYSQANYSLSLFGGRSKGVTEGKGEAVLSASGYRYCPELIQRRKIPQSLYERIRIRPKQAAAAAAPGPSQAAVQPTAAQELVAMPESEKNKKPGVEMSRELYDMAGFAGNQQVEHVTLR